MCDPCAFEGRERGPKQSNRLDEGEWGAATEVAFTGMVYPLVHGLNPVTLERSQKTHAQLCVWQENEFCVRRKTTHDCPRMFCPDLEHPSNAHLEYLQPEYCLVAKEK